MSEILRYVLEDSTGLEEEYEYESFNEARESAEKSDMAVIERSYVFDDSYVVWTPDGSTTWPRTEEVDDGE